MRVLGGTLRAGLRDKVGSGPRFLEGGQGPRFLPSPARLFVMLLCVLPMKIQHQCKRINSYSRARHKLSVKRVTRTNGTPAVTPLQDGETSIMTWHVFSPFLINVPKFLPEESAFLHTHSTDFLGCVPLPQSQSSG